MSLKSSLKDITDFCAVVGYQHITALFMSADPLHRLHERLVRLAIDKADLVVIFLLKEPSGEDKKLDFDLRLSTLNGFCDQFLARERVRVVPLANADLEGFLGEFDEPLDSTNPKVQCHIAKTFGADKIVIGQTHAGLGMFYDHNTAHTALDAHARALGLTLIVMPELVYCTHCRTIVSTKTCPHGAHHWVRYHSSTLKSLLFAGVMPPAILMRKEVSAALLGVLFKDRFSDLQSLCDDLFPSSGLIEPRTLKDFYEQLMGLYQTTSLT